MPSKKCRSQFTSYLRQHGIKYTIWPNHVDINHFRFNFLEQSERIIIRCGYDVPFTYSIPYSAPDTIIKKALNFHQCINQKYPGKTLLIPAKKIARVKVVTDKKIVLKNEAAKGLMC